MGLSTLEKITELVKKGETVALITIIKSSGSTPRKSGTLMGVWEKGVVGTIGGGLAEFDAINKARECLKEKKDEYFIYDMSGKESSIMNCGGKIEGYIKVIIPPPRIVIIGAGHIGETLFKLIDENNFEKLLLDDRNENASKEYIKVGEYTQLISDLPEKEETYFVIATKGHETDEIALEAILKKKFRYIGMIGSKKKVLGIKEKIEKKGYKIPKEIFYAPIGLKISNGTPYEIAVEILAEILKIKNDGTLEHRRIEC